MPLVWMRDPHKQLTVLSVCRFKQEDDLASESSNPLADTMLQIYDASDNGYIVWNDQVPGSSGRPPSTPHAHSKGTEGSDGCPLHSGLA